MGTSFLSSMNGELFQDTINMGSDYFLDLLIMVITAVGALLLLFVFVYSWWTGNKLWGYPERDRESQADGDDGCS